jgi:hypothetical protein
MKKTLMGLLLLCAIISGAFGQSGEIRELTGNVEIKPAGAGAFIAAKSGDQIAKDTVVSTGFRSTAIIAVGSSIIIVRPLTRLTLAEIQSASNTENLSVNLQAGRVRVNVKPPAGTKANIPIQSPVATASVRGTSFEFDTENLDVFEGSVAFEGTSEGPVTMVQSGESSYMGTDGQPVPPAIVSAAVLLPSAPVGTPEVETLADSPSGIAGYLPVILNY